MKKITCLIILLLGIIQANASLRQTKYRWRNDDGNETAATWMAAENTPVTIFNTAPSIRLRIEFDNDNGNLTSSPLDETLEYSSDGGATWTPMTNAPGDAFVYTTSTFVTNGTPTTNQMGSSTPGTYMAGRIVTSPSPSQDLDDGARTEYEWVIKPTNDAVPGTTYIFQTSGQEAAPVNYPELTISPICSGPPIPGSITPAATTIDCHSTTTLTLTGNTVAVGINYQWQYANTGPWTDFGTNTDAVTTPPMILNTQYRCIVSCSSGGADTTDAVTIETLPLPVDIGNDINACIDPGGSVTLDAGALPNDPAYLWEDGSTSKTRPVSVGGSYSVKVTDTNGCVGEDTINVILRDNPVVNLGNDTSICNKARLKLDAGAGGIEYFWNTGQNTQTIEVNAAGSYNVFVINSEGCSQGDTIEVVTSGELPTVQGIDIDNDGQFTFTFSPVNPQNIIAYDWDFGDGVHSSLASPTHTYLQPGNYIVTLNLTSSCGYQSYTASAHIVGIDQIRAENDKFVIYPNPAKGAAVIINQGDLKMERIEVYDISGRIVYKAVPENNSRHYMQLGDLSSGVYSIEIYTGKGVATRKLQVQK